MPISPTLIEALNTQFNHERSNHVLYMALSDAMSAESWPGCAHWFGVQAAEEADHARRVAKFILDQEPFEVFVRSGPDYGPLDAPAVMVAPLSAPFKMAYEREKETTRMIDQLYHLAVMEESPATLEFLHWFIREQVEEEATLVSILQELTRSENDQAALLLLDEKYSKR